MTPILRPARNLALGLVLASTAPLIARAAFTEHSASILNNVNYDSRSASLADIDNDGDLDLFFQGATGAQQIFRNNLIGTGSLSYTRLTSALPSGLGSSWSAAWGDYDGDGFLDVFVGQTNSGATGDVLRNNGNNTFANTSVATGLNDPGFHQNVAWSDINNDGLLDLVIGMEGPEKHEIYLQGANQHFTPVGASVGFQADYGTKSYGMALGDADGDGDVDVYISTCISTGIIRNNFFKNMLKETGSLGFIDVADANGTQFMQNSYGAEFHDFDDDGTLDLFMVGADGLNSKIFRNNGNGTFTDVDTFTGHPLLSDPGTDLNGARVVDYDNDGDLDLFLHDHLERSGYSHARKLYRNDGDWQFTDVTLAEGIDTVNQGAYDSTWGDIDRDGDMDLIAPTNSNFSEKVFINDAQSNGNHWLQVDLHGPSGNTSGIGASLYATINAGTPEERTLRREANTNAGTFNQSDLPVHFGLGGASVIDELRVAWPDGTIQVLFDVPVDQYMSISIAKPGDFNNDGLVDGSDLLIWQRGELGDGASAAQLAKWQSGFGSATAVAANTPEPSAFGALAVCILSAAACSKRRRLTTRVRPQN